MDSWRFVHVADIQPGSPRSFRFNPQWTENWHCAKARIAALAPDLVLVGGDLTRDGSIHRFELLDMKRDLDRLGLPYHVVPGNMDTGNKHTRITGQHRRAADQCNDAALNVTRAQLQQFSEVFGPLQWTVEHRNARFSGFADVVVNSGLPEETDFWRWAEDLVRRPRLDHHVWIMHYALFADRPEEPNWDISDPAQYLNWYFTIDQPGRGRLLDLFKRSGANLVISAHIHCRRTMVVDTIRFDAAPAVSFGQWADRWPDGDDSLGFLVYTVAGTRIEGRFEPLGEVPPAAGASYGPGGHPKPEARDYRLAHPQR